jgi:16S rRNA G966 N2-methylase RsmD
MQGVDFRRNAEKSVIICEYLMELFTVQGEMVLDLFAGTASMGSRA